MREKIWQWLAGRLPSGLIYWAAIHVIAHATSGKHGDTEIQELSALEAVGRYGEDFGVGGEAKKKD